MKKKILLIVIVVLMAIVLGALGFYIYMGKSKVLFEYEINHIYESMTNFGSSSNLVIDKAFTISVDMDIQEEDLPNYNLITYLGMDVNNHKFGIKAGVKDNDANELSIEGIIDEDTLYITSEELFDKSLTYSLEGYDLWSFIDTLWSYFDTSETYSTEDYTYLIELVKDEFLDSLEDSDFTKEYTKIDVDGSEVEVAKHTLSLNSDRLTTISKNIIKSLLTDEKSLSILENILDEEIDVDEVLASLEDDVIDNTLEISFYTKKYSYSLVKVVIDTDSTNIEYVIDTKKLTMLDKDSLETILITFNELSENKIDANVEIEDYTASIIIELVSNTNTEVEYNFSLTINDLIDLSGVVNIKNTYEGLNPLTQTVDITDLTDSDYNKIAMNLVSNGIITYFIGEDYLESALISAFETEIGDVVSATSLAISGINSSTITDNYTEEDGTFCITINDLIKENILDSTYDEYEGKVIVSNGYYYVTMHNDNYMVRNYIYNYSDSSIIKDYVSGTYNYDC